MIEIDLEPGGGEFAVDLLDSLDDIGARASTAIAKDASNIAANLSLRHSKTGSYAGSWFWRPAPKGGVASVGNTDEKAAMLEVGAQAHEIPGPLKIPGENPNRVGRTGNVNSRVVRGIFGSGGRSRRGRQSSGTFIREGMVVDHPGFDGFHILEDALDQALSNADVL